MTYRRLQTATTPEFESEHEGAYFALGAFLGCIAGALATSRLAISRKQQSPLSPVRPRPSPSPLEEAIALYHGRYERSVANTRRSTYEYSVKQICSRTGIPSYELYAALQRNGDATRTRCDLLCRKANQAYAQSALLVTKSASRARVVQDIARELGLSTRTIYRYTQTMQTVS